MALPIIIVHSKRIKKLVSQQQTPAICNSHHLSMQAHKERIVSIYNNIRSKKKKIAFSKFTKRRYCLFSFIKVVVAPSKCSILEADSAARIYLDMIYKELYPSKDPPCQLLVDILKKNQKVVKKHVKRESADNK